jgi:hypothetical protein|tara:strand:- start:5015 stop:5569 length:555 start_codon:yes stop_codon:yes gene_type:complete
MRSLIDNKKGNTGIIIVTFFIILFMVLFLGFIFATGTAVVDYFFDVFAPEVSNLGVIQGANFTYIDTITVDVLNDFIQSFTWLAGVGYIFVLVGAIVIPFMFRTGAETWLIGFFFVLMLVLIIASIFISNIYEDFYDDTGELADRLKEQVLLSYLVLNSPLIFTIISFISGLVLFTGLNREEFV